MKINDILNIDSIVVNLEIDNKEKLLTLMLDLAAKSGKVTDKEMTLKEIFAREQVLSTGIGKGIALPHAKTKHVVDSCASLVILKNPIDYDSLDGQPVRIVVMLIGLDTNVALHLKYLSKISRLLNNDSFRNQLLNCNSSNEVLQLLMKVEEKD